MKQEEFENWRKKVTSLSLECIRRMDRMIGSKSVLSKQEVKEYIITLHDKYIIIPADKAVGNFIVVCKKYYLMVLGNELGLGSDFSCESSGTYMIVPEDANEVI